MKTSSKGFYDINVYDVNGNKVKCVVRELLADAATMERIIKEHQKFAGNVLKEGEYFAYDYSEHV